MASYNANADFNAGEKYTVGGDAPSVSVNVNANNNVNANLNANSNMNVNYQQPNMNMQYQQPNVNMQTPNVNYNQGYQPQQQYGGGMNVGYQQQYVGGMNMGYGQPQYGMGGVVVVNNMMNIRPWVCGRPVPKISPCAAIAVLILNIFWSGLGTMVCGCVPHEGSMNCIGDCCCFFWLGFAHFILWYFIVGWILAMILGCQLIQVASMPFDDNVVVGGVGGQVVVM